MVISSKEQHVLAKAEAGVCFERRLLYITGEVDSAMARKVIIALHSLDAEAGQITIFMNCTGGDEEDGYAIHDAITMCQNPVVVNGYGNVCSIAAAIFQAADVRRLAPNAAFMIHNGTVGGEERMQQNQVVDMAEQIKKDNQKYYDILSAASGQPQDLIEEWCREEKYFTAQEAQEAGFTDEVIVPLKSRIPVTTKKKRRKKS